jgi:dephospho-CoA kinase
MERHENSQVKVVGLTGGIGSGKSTVAQLFAEQGVHWVDADDVAREVVEPGTPALKAITEHFGSHILLETGELSRAELRTLIFQDEAERKWLEQLLHPLIREAMLEQLQPRDYDLPYTLLVSPLLLETDQHELVDKVVVIDVPADVQLERTVSRDGNSLEQVQRIIDAQMSREERLKKADLVIDNSATENARAKVAEIHERFIDDFKRTR